MNPRKNTAMNTDDIFRTMREMLMEAPGEELAELAREADLDVTKLTKASREMTSLALRERKLINTKADSSILLHKGLNSLLVMLRRRDGLDEDELALKAGIDEAEIRRIEYDSEYMPSPRTIYKLEQAFALPGGVLAKLSGAIKHQSPALEERVLEFAANAKSIGKLTKAERELLNAFVKFLTDRT